MFRKAKSWRVLNYAQSIATLPVNEQVDALVEVARRDSLNRALDVARFIKSAKVLRSFYNQLTDRFYMELRQAGKLQDIF